MVLNSHTVHLLIQKGFMNFWQVRDFNCINNVSHIAWAFVTQETGWMLVVVSCLAA